jgi:hypothetical protein
MASGDFELFELFYLFWPTFTRVPAGKVKKVIFHHFSSLAFSQKTFWNYFKVKNHHTILTFDAHIEFLPDRFLLFGIVRNFDCKRAKHGCKKTCFFL